MRVISCCVTQINHPSMKSGRFKKPISIDLLSSDQKQTLGITTDSYDWESNSSGQDNIGKILLAVLSFKRLKKQYKEEYKGGILAIDEIDATLFPGSQEELIKALSYFCSKYEIQVICPILFFLSFPIFVLYSSYIPTWSACPEDFWHSKRRLEGWPGPGWLGGEGKQFCTTTGTEKYSLTCLRKSMY